MNYRFLGIDGGYKSDGTTASRFGDNADVESGDDNGVSAFGYRYVDNPDCLGVALPTQYGGSLYAYKDSLVPFVGANHGTCTKVRIHSTQTGKSVDCVYIDKGPSANQTPDRQVDLLDAVVLALGLELSAGLYRVDSWVLPKGRTHIGLVGTMAIPNS